MIRRRRPGRDRGSFTAEFAVGLPALGLLLMAGLTGIGGVMAKLQCLDAARAGALAASRGDSGTAAAAALAPPGASVDLALSDDAARVTVTAPIRMLGGVLPALNVTATSVSEREPDGLP